MGMKEKLWEICKDIYRQMYGEASPKADFDELRKEGLTGKINWFMKYYLPQKRQIEIVSEHCKKHKLRGLQKRAVEQEIHLGCSPNTSEKTWKEELAKK